MRKKKLLTFFQKFIFIQHYYKENEEKIEVIWQRYVYNEQYKQK